MSNLLIVGCESPVKYLALNVVNYTNLCEGQEFAM